MTMIKPLTRAVALAVISLSTSVTPESGFGATRNLRIVAGDTSKNNNKHQNRKIAHNVAMRSVLQPAAEPGYCGTLDVEFLVGYILPPLAVNVTDASNTTIPSKMSYIVANVTETYFTSEVFASGFAWNDHSNVCLQFEPPQKVYHSISAQQCSSLSPTSASSAAKYITYFFDGMPYSQVGPQNGFSMTDVGNWLTDVFLNEEENYLQYLKNNLPADNIYRAVTGLEPVSVDPPQGGAHQSSSKFFPASSCF